MVRASRWVVAVAAGLFAATAAVADDSTLKVKEGDAFPDVTLHAAQVEKIPGKKAGDTVSIADLKGKTVVVFFYPKALTKGCTIESCGFRDLAAKFPKDAVLVGASADDEALQKKFIDTNMLPYALLCDTDLKLIQSLGIQSPKGKVPQRVTFVVGKDGKIAKIYSKVTPADHPTEVLKFVEELK
ncbi:peroxiredoxin [Fimbriiglobus ruber]|uniref:thioredoxin-dependent peroxiredoxin n=1 Tax=Fimbriiglobus ruber TaxID=1908690 RepID=A0A225D0C5_9BACT|nr:peroxiredoxin [Fimbriiglobus ruber]OWK35070.1 Alkyl hydroperoxide reductase subunit C-like protein [Fimbriiglobus ruber]